MQPGMVPTARGFFAATIRPSFFFLPPPKGEDFDRSGRHNRANRQRIGGEQRYGGYMATVGVDCFRVSMWCSGVTQGSRMMLSNQPALSPSSLLRIFARSGEKLHNQQIESRTGCRQAITPTAPPVPDRKAAGWVEESLHRIGIGATDGVYRHLSREFTARFLKKPPSASPENRQTKITPHADPLQPTPTQRPLPAIGHGATLIASLRAGHELRARERARRSRGFDLGQTPAVAEREQRR